MEGTKTPALLSSRAAAKHLGIGVDRFRRIIRQGHGPRSWNPDGGRPMYAVRVLDEWAAHRDDPQAA